METAEAIEYWLSMNHVTSISLNQPDCRSVNANLSLPLSLL